MRLFGFVLITLILAPHLASPQSVPAPNAVTLTITKVDMVKEHHGETSEAAAYTTDVDGYRVRAVSPTVEYELSCIVRTTNMTSHVGGQVQSLVTDDDSHAFLFSNGRRVSPQPTCQQFHVGEKVQFYSLDNLIWMSRTDQAGHVLVHGDSWKPKMVPIGDEPVLLTYGNAWFEDKEYSIDSEILRSRTRTKSTTALHKNN